MKVYCCERFVELIKFGSFKILDEKGTLLSMCIEETPFINQIIKYKEHGLDFKFCPYCKADLIALDRYNNIK